VITDPLRSTANRLIVQLMEAKETLRRAGLLASVDGLPSWSLPLLSAERAIDVALTEVEAALRAGRSEWSERAERGAPSDDSAEGKGAPPYRSP